MFKAKSNRICYICKKEFIPLGSNQKYCSKPCRNKYFYNKNKEYNKNWRITSMKRKEWYKGYYKSEKYIKVIEKIKSNPEYKEKRKINYLKYNHSFKGKMNSRKNDSKRKYNISRILHKFTKEEYEIKLKQTKGRCQICNKLIGFKKLTLDHIIPISKAKNNFIYTINDVQFLCKSCNSRKKDKLC